MIVQELIEALQKLDPSTRCVIRGYEQGVNDLNEIREVHLDLDASDSWYYGQHNVRTDAGGVKAYDLCGTNKLSDDDDPKSY